MECLCASANSARCLGRRVATTLRCCHRCPPLPLLSAPPASQVCFREEREQSYYIDYFTRAEEAANTITDSEEDDCVRLACQVSSGKKCSGKNAKQWVLLPRV